MTSHRHLWILGGGPAAWSLAGAASARGLNVGLVAPSPTAPFKPSYGVWADDWEHAGLPSALERTWASVGVAFNSHRVSFDRPYARLSNARLAEHLHHAASDVALVDAFVAHTDGERVHLRNGSTLTGDVVVDATGARSSFLKRTGSTTGASQTAWGIDAEVTGWSDPVEQALFMDFSGPEHPTGSFLYALPSSSGRVFLEETSLAASPAVPLAELERRLYARLERRGVVVRQIHATERCVIPMDPSLPCTRQALVGFGAAAAWVHPATGYTLSHTLKRAPAVASAIAEGLASGGSPALARDLAWQAVWPRNARLSNRLHRYGLRSLLSLTDAQQRAFFEGFFALPEPHWSAYLNPDAPVSELCSAMLRVFAGAGAPLRWHLATAGLHAAPTARPHPAPSGGSA